MEDFYSYIQEEDNEDIISYSFLTHNGSLYSVYFDPYQYVKYISEYPGLFTQGYGFGFNRVLKSKNWEKDPLIGVTIAKIVIDFIEERGSGVVLLYHCDYVDNKQNGRNKIFNTWFDLTNVSQSIVDNRVKVDLPQIDGSVLHTFMGYLTSINNINRGKASEEFTAFAERLAVNK